MSLSSGEVKAGSEFYAWKEGKNSNILENSQDYSDNSFIRWFQEKTWTGDSEGDQRAIFRGYYMGHGRTGLFDFFDPDAKPSGIRLDGLTR
jgi:hypothetical protein